MTFKLLLAFLLHHFVFSKGGRRKEWQQGHKWAAAASVLTLKLIKTSGSEREVLENGQIDQICAINCGIL